MLKKLNSWYTLLTKGLDLHIFAYSRILGLLFQAKCFTSYDNDNKHYSQHTNNSTGLENGRDCWQTRHNISAGKIACESRTQYDITAKSCDVTASDASHAPSDPRRKSEQRCSDELAVVDGDSFSVNSNCYYPNHQWDDVIIYHPYR